MEWKCARISGAKPDRSLDETANQKNIFYSSSPWSLRAKPLSKMPKDSGIEIAGLMEFL